MKQLLILSGKGGTGKTTVAGAFIRLSEAKAYADCDVDAPNLHMVVEKPELSKKRDYFGLPTAKIDQELCIKCDKCRQICRFDAIEFDGLYNVKDFACEGCGVCRLVCPSKAITLKPHVAGDLMLYLSDNVFSTAQLRIGSGTSGKLVTEVKKQLKEYESGIEFAIIDGSPGIGCPVIASISGVDMVLIVTEPTVSGISDLKRIVKTAEMFDTKIAVCINKFDTNKEMAERIKNFCTENKITFTGNIPYDNNVLKAVNSGKNFIDYDTDAGNAIKEVFKSTIKILFNSDRNKIV